MSERRAIALEVAVSLFSAAAFVASCLLIRVFPTERIGQVSALASLAFRFVICSVVLVAALVIAARRGGFDLTSRLVCAATSGIASGIVGGGILAALYGTPWGLNGQGGDAGALMKWATDLQHGGSVPPTYPPLSLHILRYYSDLTGLTPDLALKHMEIMGCALAGPIAYFSWRLLFRPTWALAIGVIGVIPLIEPYKPFPNLVLATFVPVAILYLKYLRTSHRRAILDVWRAGVAFGATFGLMCLMYSGWFQWAAPGLLVATLIVYPWRKAKLPGLHFLAITGVLFVLLTNRYMAGLLFDPAGKIADRYVYFDVKTDPMYFNMWRNDTPGPIADWPPLGELGGVGLFTLLLATGLGLAITLARKTTLVITTTAMMVGALFMRFFYARRLWDTKLVQLYPRTTPLILYCLMILTGYALYWWVSTRDDDHPARSKSGVIGALCALLLVFASAGTATSDRYMPVNTTPPGGGWLTYNAYRLKWSQHPFYTSHAMPWVRRR